MRTSKAQSQSTRAEIVEVAASRIRERGFAGTTVADLMSDVGLTHGGFYNHFASKDSLVVEAVEQAFRQHAGERAKAGAIAEVLRWYLSAAHVAAPGGGCPAAALGSEVARQSDQVKAAFGAGIEDMIRDFCDALGEAPRGVASRRSLAIDVLAKAVGAIVLSRAAYATDRLSREILSTCLAGALRDLDASRAK